MPEDAAAVGDEPEIPEFTDEELEEKFERDLERFKDLLEQIPRG